MFAVKQYSEFIQQPASSLEACQDGPVEISGEQQSYVIMTTEYLRQLLADTVLADQLDKIFSKMQNGNSVPEQKIMSLLEHE